MPYAPRSTTIFPNSTSSGRQPSTHSSSSQQSVLAARIAAKRSELENLKLLRDLSGTLATQMSVLEEKLATLRDGTEAVACVLANWDNVLRAISMASGEFTIIVYLSGSGFADKAPQRKFPNQ
jgi:DASH complex subunit DAD2